MDNPVKEAVEKIGGTERGAVAKAAGIIGVSSESLHRWIREGNLLKARADVILKLAKASGVSVTRLMGEDE